MRFQRFLNLYPPVGKCVYVIRFWFSHGPFFLNSHTVSFTFMEYQTLKGARTWMSWKVSLEQSQCDTLNTQLPPYVNLCIYKRKLRSKVEDSKGKNQNKLHILCSLPNLETFTPVFWKIDSDYLMVILAQSGFLLFFCFCFFFVFSFCSPDFPLLGSEIIQLLSPFYYHVSEKKKDDYS